MSALVGATITSVRESDWGDVVILGLADGREARFVAHSYEDASIETLVLSPTERRRAAAVEQGAREVDRVRRLQRQARAATREARIAAARASMSPEEFGAWMDETYGMAGAHAVLKQVYAGPIMDALREQSMMFNRQFFGEVSDVDAR